MYDSSFFGEANLFPKKYSRIHNLFLVKIVYRVKGIREFPKRSRNCKNWNRVLSPVTV